MRFFALLFSVLAWSFQAEADVYDPNFKLSQIKEVNVHLLDNAKGACWTNLREVREYAEEKLRMRGVKVVDQRMSLVGEQTYTLAIAVHSRRLYNDGTGPCWGNFDLGLMTFAWINGRLHSASIGNYYFSSTHKTNQNRRVIEAVSKFLAEFK
jgi:hypothetical protein